MSHLGGRSRKAGVSVRMKMVSMGLRKEGSHRALESAVGR